MFNEITSRIVVVEQPKETIFVPNQNKLERTPNKDSFVKSNPVDNNVITPSRKPNVKMAYIIGGAGIVVATTVGMVATGQVQRYRTQLRNMANQVDDVLRENQQLNAQVQKLTSTIDDMLSKAKTSTQPDPQIKNRYMQMLEDVTLPYRHTEAPFNIRKPYFSKDAKLVRLSEIKPLAKPQNAASEFIRPEKLKEILTRDGAVDVTIPRRKNIIASVSPKAYIGDDIIEGLGKTTKTDITLEYGKRVDWSEEKIARDILQNFYDGHGNTLDGVRVILQKQPNGQTKVRIVGEGLFEHTNLQYIGAGNKSTNPYNAGGFGEGSKVLVSNMLGKQDASSIKFSCADWDLVFGTDGTLMTRTLTKAQEVLNGNSIEFETGNDKLVDAIIDAINYFKHSSNPDLADMTFDNPSFAFKILKNGEKGNFYLTQRFEFEKDGAWQDAVEDLTILFKRKPDPEEYFKITGKKLPKDRDRTHMSVDDIRNLTRYYAAEMTDDELLGTIKSTRDLWTSITLRTDSKKPIKAFIDGISDELKKRNIYLDMADEKFAYAPVYVDEIVVKTLKSYGYHILPENFEKLGLYSATDIFKNLSQHKALQPTATEIKKIKILDEAMKIIQESMDVEVATYLAKADIKFTPLQLKENAWSFSKFLREISQNSPDIIPPQIWDYRAYLARLDSNELENVTNCINQLISDKLKSMQNTPNSDEARKLISDIQSISFYTDNVDLKEYVKKIRHLQMISPEDIKQPRYIFDRHSEIAKDTLGEAIIQDRQYLGHWIDREYFNSSDFNQLLGTWLHENCHKYGGDGSENFTYALTDLIRSLLDININQEDVKRLAVLQEIFDSL